MNHVEAAVMERVARLYSEIIHAAYMCYCENNASYLDRRYQRILIEKYNSIYHILTILHRFRRAGLNFCYPTLSSESKELCAADVFDLALAKALLAKGTTVVCNDFYLKGKERIFIVSGPNNGGKTTFARMFGQLHYLASLGCLVPGRNVKLFLFDQILTHFEREEDISNLHGKLQDDLVRIHDILNRATSRSIIIMNEIFSSATLKDAIYLGTKVIERIVQLDALCVCVTFIDELTLLSDKIVSAVSTVVPERPAVRTYKIVRKPADGLAYAMSIAEKYAPYAPANPGTDQVMKAFLMYRDRDFDLEAALPPNSEALIQDLELDVLFDVMAQGDKYLREVVSKAVLQILRNEDEVRYRQDVLRDVLANPLLVRFLYDLTIEAHEKEKKAHSWGYLKSPSSILGQSVDVLQSFVALLKQLRGVGTYNAKRFSSEGFTTFFAMLDRELNDDYFVSIQDHLNRLKFRDGVLISAVLGTGFKGANYTLRKPNDQPGNWIERLMRRKPPGYTWRLPPRDEQGANALGELRDRGLNLVANALAQSDDHILSFFAMLRTDSRSISAV